MRPEEEFEGLFESTLPDAQQPIADPLRVEPEAISALAPALDLLLNQSLPALVGALIERERRKALVHRVDGRIIGTGEADFTKGNTRYQLNCEGKIFLLIDVPGIEGDEVKYVDEVRKAVAQAHLVFYVNGTNKKPEKATAEKIRSYLRRGTQVCPLINVRGSADAYEFDEDRVMLEQQGGASAALLQTVDVIKPVLGEEVLLPGHCVQGLLAFSSLAFNSSIGGTSIHPSRERDLVIQQRNYLKHFTSTQTMFEFSQIQAVAQVLQSKLSTFEKDIVESNKIKVRELLAEYLATLHQEQLRYRDFLDKVTPEFDKCRDAIDGAVKSFEHSTLSGRQTTWRGFFSELAEVADNLVAEHFGDADQITMKIDHAFQELQRGVEGRLQQHFEESSKLLSELIQQATTRLIQDMQRVELQQRLVFEPGRYWGAGSGMNLDRGLSLGDLGSIAFKVGSYALMGGGIGSSFAPGIGTAIGAAIGIFTALIMTGVDLLLSKDRRIRKAQVQVRSRIEKVRDQVLGDLPSEVKTLVKSVEKEVQDGVLAQVTKLHDTLQQPLVILDKQMVLMSSLKEQLEKMPYGTIQAVQH